MASRNSPPSASPGAAHGAPLPPRSRQRRRPWWARTFGWLLQPWLALKIETQTTSDGRLIGDGRPVVYVLERQSLSHALILERACAEAGLPSPWMVPPGDPVGRARAYLFLGRRRGGVPPPGLGRVLAVHREHPDLDVQLVPVSIFVGRAPDRQSGWFRVLFAENWALVGRFRRALAIALNGRNTIVRFSAPTSAREILAEALPPERTVRKLSRVLRAHFRRIRATVIGPDLSHRRLLVDRVLDAEPVRRAIADHARRENRKPAAAWRTAHRYAWEIAADYSHPVVRSMSFALSFLWNRIYDGVSVNHLDSLKQHAPGHEVVYVPCHRSHIDYLLLSYLTFTHGIVPPHIVAGDNLNMPVLGSILRRGGAFFIRRSIRGNPLYSAVLAEYVALLVGEGFSIEYFIEGGRSRTGRLLPGKGGMLIMTLRAFLRQPRRPVMFQPIYIGYEKVIEGKSYLDELSGQPKQKETLWALLRAGAGILRRRYGKVTVNFGEPIFLDDVLARHAPQWRELRLQDDQKPTWLSAAVDDLSRQILVNVNRAADVNPVNLLALALLSTPKHAMSEGDLCAQLRLLKQLLDAAPYSPRVTVTPMTPEEIIAYGGAIGILTRTRHPLGDVLSLEGETGVLQAYYRNNVLHLFVAAAWVACCFQHNRRMSRAGVVRLGRLLYPFVQGELFVAWSEDEFAAQLQETIDVLVREGLLETENEQGVLCRGAGQTDEVYRLRSIAQSLQQAFERYYIAIAILVKNGPGTVTSTELELLCQLTAQRLSLLYAPAAPEFFDRTLFRGFIQRLRELGIVWLNPEARLDFDERLHEWASDAKVILGREVRHTIIKLSPETLGKAKPASTPESG
jgi:glycerol-3-phosphate O-acyltransferase